MNVSALEQENDRLRKAIADRLEMQAAIPISPPPRLQLQRIGRILVEDLDDLVGEPDEPAPVIPLPPPKRVLPPTRGFDPEATRRRAAEGVW